MKTKYIISLVVVLYLIFFGACKKKTPTGPNGNVTIKLSGVITLDAQPFSNVEVNLSGDSSKKTTTGSDGKFSFVNLLSGSYVITPSKKGYTFSPASYEAGSQTRNDLNFAAQLVNDGNVTIELSGVITLDAKPFSNVEVNLSGDSSKKTATGSDGKFSFVNLLSGSYVITPSKKGYTFSPASYEAGSQTRNDLNFVAQLVQGGSKVGDIAANFTAKDQNNNDVSLYDYSDKVVLFNFSADWCGPCREEATHLEALYSEYKDRGFQVITLLISGSPAVWASEYHLTFPVLDDNDQKIWDVYGEGYIPLNIVIDRDLTIRYKKAGYYESEIRAIIEDYL